MSDERKDKSVSQVAKLFNTSGETVRRWIESGRLRAYRLGGDGAYRVLWSEVERVQSEWVVRPQQEL